MLAICIWFVLAAGTICVSLKYLSVIVIARWFHCVVFGRGRRVYVATNSNGLHDGNNCRGFFCWYWLPSVPAAAQTLCGSSICINYHVWPVVLFSKPIIHTSLSRMSVYWRWCVKYKIRSRVFMVPRFGWLRRLSIFELGFLVYWKRISSWATPRREL